VVTVDEGNNDGWTEDFLRDEMRSFTEGEASLSMSRVLAVI